MSDLTKKRQYFYRDSAGILQKYIYCSLCGKGPFEQTSKDVSYIIGQSQKIYHCTACQRVHDFNFDMHDVGGDKAERRQHLLISVKLRCASELNQETMGTVKTPTVGKWFNIIVMSASRKYSCFYCDDVDKFLTDINVKKSFNDKKPTIRLPVKLVYKRGCDTKIEAETINDLLKIKSSEFKNKLIANYSQIIG